MSLIFFNSSSSFIDFLTKLGQINALIVSGIPCRTFFFKDFVFFKALSSKFF